MTPKTFNELLERRVVLTCDVLVSKSAEYSTSRDKLHNFKQSAELANERTGDRVVGEHIYIRANPAEYILHATTPAAGCCGFMRKHIVSVFDLVQDMSKGGAERRKLIDEKIGDAVNYLILLEALLVEAMSSEFSG